MHKKRKILLLSVAAVLLALVVGCVVYLCDYYRADETAQAAMAGSETVTVRQQDGMAIFEPETPIAGFVFYPGGKVEYTAYAPLMLALAERNVLCVIVKMPCNLAVLNQKAAEGIPQLFPQVERWYIGGHSLGGSMAASYAANHSQDWEGLVLLAAYSTAEVKNLSVLSMYGDRDGVLNMDKYEKYRGNLPENTVELVIAGGNHANFGSYGPQSGDGTAEISPAQQVEQTADAILALTLSGM